MKNILIILLTTYFNICFSQVVPPPPPIPKNNVQNDGENSESEKSIKIVEVKNVKNKKSKIEVCQIEKFKIESKNFTDIKSKFYFKTIENKLNNLDTNISSEEIISYTKYRNSLEFDPFKIDSISLAIYKLNENSKYENAIKLCDKLKTISPNNITLHKELSFAYKRLGRTDISEKHFEIMKKIIIAVEKYSDGCRINPYILNNCFEGVSLYEAKFSLYPKKARFIQTESKKIIYGYEIYHIMRFADLNHYKKYLNQGDYKIE